MLLCVSLGAWLQSGEGGIGWLAAGTIPNSLYRVPFIYLFLACAVIVYSVWDRVGSSGESESIVEYTSRNRVNYSIYYCYK